MVVPESGPFPGDFGIPRLGFNGPRLEPWIKDREHGGRIHALAYTGLMVPPASASVVQLG